MEQLEFDFSPKQETQPAPAEDRFAALRGTPEPEELEEHGPEFPDGSDADGFPGGDERFAEAQTQLAAELATGEALSAADFDAKLARREALGLPTTCTADEFDATPTHAQMLELLKFDQAVIEAAKAIGKSRDGKTYCINEPQQIDGQLYAALDRALVARRVARGEPR